MTPDSGVTSQDGRLETWRDVIRPWVFQMVSWWDDAIVSAAICDRRNIGFPTHEFLHEPDRPRGTGVRRYVLLPDS